MDNPKPQKTIKLNELISLCIQITHKSQQIFEKAYNKAITPKIYYKHDNKDRFTDCDWLIQKVYELYLTKYFPSIRLIGEEDTTLDIIKEHEVFNIDNEINLNLVPETSIPPEYQNINTDELYALLDPIDATERFLKEDYEPVTSLIAFVYKNKPFLGFIYYPYENLKTQVCYFNIPSKGVFMYKNNEISQLKPLRRNDNEYAFLLSKRKPMENAIKIFENFPGYIIINEHGVGHKSMVGIIQDALFLFPSKGSAIWDICAGDCLAREYGGGYYTTKGEEYPYDPEKPYLMDCCYFTPSKYKAEKFAEVFNTCGVQFP